MITSLAQYITDILLENNTIKREYLDIYVYGFEVLISSVLSVFICMVLGSVFSQIIECVVFLIVFVALREFCGGYHAETYLKCNLIFASNIATVMIILKKGIIYSFVFHMILCILCVSIIFMVAPIENIYKEITCKEKRKYRIIAIIISSFSVAFSSIAYFNQFRYCIVIDMAILSVVVSMIIELLRKGANYNFVNRKMKKI